MKNQHPNSASVAAAREAGEVSEDPKKGEREYFARIGEEGRRHAASKPFGDEKCTQYLMNLTVLMALMRDPPARVLEFGCGTGWLSLSLARRGYEVVGLDISPDAIAIAESLRAPLGLPNLSFRVADYEQMHGGSAADCVIFHDALHHCESEEAVLKVAYDSLAPQGMLVCIEPGDGHQHSAPSRHAVQQFGVHEKDMPPRKIIAFARKAGFGRYLVLPWPWFLLHSTYRPGYGNASSLADVRGRKFLSFWRLVRSFFQTRAQGVVVLWKT
ncbi:MAG TPA: class I SAM-dependent methyltransferase [Opitutaceae bacterium]